MTIRIRRILAGGRWALAALLLALPDSLSSTPAGIPGGDFLEKVLGDPALFSAEMGRRIGSKGKSRGIEGTEKCVPCYAGRARKNLECFAYKKFIVVVLYNRDEPGSTIAVIPRNAEGKKNYWVLPNASAEYFNGLQGNWLFIDSGTGPDPRGLVIHDLGKRVKAYADACTGPVMGQPGYLTYWKESRQATPADCPDFESLAQTGGAPALEEKVTLNLKTMGLKGSGEKRCAPRQ